MARYYVDCRDHPGDVKCSLALAGDKKEELLEAVVQHATKVHGISGSSYEGDEGRNASPLVHSPDFPTGFCIETKANHRL